MSAAESRHENCLPSSQRIMPPELIAHMLEDRRESVPEAAGKWLQLDVIDYHRVVR